MTVDELIPCIIEASKQDIFLNDDEFLFRVGNECIKLIDFCGAGAEVKTLVPCAEWLAYQEETVVRDKGVECLAIFCGVEGINVQEDILPVLQRLATAEW